MEVTPEQTLDWLNYKRYVPEYVTSEEASDAAEELLGKLRPLERAIIEMRVIGRLKYKEIGAIVGKSRSTLPRHYKRGINRLQGITVGKPAPVHVSGRGTGYRYVGMERVHLREGACELRVQGLSINASAIVLRVSVTLVNELLREAGRYVSEPCGT